MPNMYSPSINPYLYVNGCVAQVFPSDTAVAVISPGEARDDTNTYNFQIQTPLVINPLVLGPNGLDTGVLTNRVLYAVWLIGDNTGRLSDAAIMSVSQIGPQMPFVNGTQYSVKRLIGFVRASQDVLDTPFSVSQVCGDGSFRKQLWSVLDGNGQIQTGAIPSSITAINVSNFCPAGDVFSNSLCQIILLLYVNGSNATRHFLLGQNSVATLNPTHVYVTTSQYTHESISGEIAVVVTSQLGYPAIYVQSSSSGGTAIINTLGFNFSI